MTRDLRHELATNREDRTKLTTKLDGLEQQERDLIAAAWRDHVPPVEIAALTGRSPAHVRKLRPEDVPPLRTGGNAAPKG